MEFIPDEILLHIVRHLSLKDLLCFFQVNWRFASLSSDNLVWKERLHIDYPEVPLPSQCSYLKLYQYWHRYKFGKAKVIGVPEEYYPYQHNWDSKGRELACQRINESSHSECSLNILQYLKEKGARRGDIIHLSAYKPFEDDGWVESWNEGRLIFDGRQVVPLDYMIDDEYGSIPSTFQVIKEFPCNYWSGTLVQSPYYVYCNLDPYIEEIIRNFSRKDDHFISSFQYWTGCTYHIQISTYQEMALPGEELIRKKLQGHVFGCYAPHRRYQENNKYPSENTLFLPFVIVHAGDRIYYE